MGGGGLTRLAELRGAAAATRAHDGDHTGTQAGAPLLARGAQGAQRRVRLAAVVVDLAADAGALQHAPAGRTDLPVWDGRAGQVTG